jgi:hypothetical protein
MGTVDRSSTLYLLKTSRGQVMSLEGRADVGVLILPEPHV